MKAETIKISGMSCDHCVKSIREAVQKLPVEKYEVNLGSLYIEYNPEKIERNEIINAISDSGYDVVNNS